MAVATTTPSVGMQVLQSVLTTGQNIFAISKGVNLSEGFTPALKVSTATPTSFGGDTAVTAIIVVGAIVLILALFRKK